MPTSGRGDQDTAALAAWFLGHGFGTLWQSGALDRALADRDPSAVFRAAAQLFAAPDPQESTETDWLKPR